MNPRPPHDGPTPPPPPNPRDELEARLTALALGEAGEFEVATLRARLQAEPELAALYRRIEAATLAYKNTFEDERASATLPPLEPAPEHLSPDRMAKLAKLFAEDNAAASKAAPAVAVVGAKPSKRTRKLLPFPVWAQVAAVACVAVFVGLILTSTMSSTLSMSKTLASGQNHTTIAAVTNSFKPTSPIDKEAAPGAVKENFLPQLQTAPAETTPTPAPAQILSAADLAQSVSAQNNSNAALITVPSLNTGVVMPNNSVTAPSLTYMQSGAVLAANEGAANAPMGSGSTANYWMNTDAAAAQNFIDNAAIATPEPAVAELSPPPPPPPPPPPTTVASTQPTRTSGAGGGGFGAGGYGGASPGRAGQGGGFSAGTGGRRGGAGGPGGRPGGGVGSGGRPGGGAAGAAVAAAPAAAPASGGSIYTNPTLVDTQNPAIYAGQLFGRGSTAQNNPNSSNVTFANDGSLLFSDTSVSGNQNVTLYQNISTFGGDAGPGPGSEPADAGGQLAAAGAGPRAANSLSGLKWEVNQSNYGVSQGETVASDNALQSANLGGLSGNRSQMLGSGTAVGTGTFTITGGNLDNTSGGGPLAGTSTLDTVGNNVVYTSAPTGLDRAVLSGSAGNLTKAGNGTLTLAGNNIYGNTLTIGGAISSGGGNFVKADTGTFMLSGGTLQIGNAVAQSGGAVNLPAAIGGNLSGNTMTQATTGYLTLSGNNTYAGGVTVNSGTVDFNSLHNFGSGEANGVILSGGGVQWGVNASTDVTGQMSGNDTLDTKGNNVAFNSVLSGNGSLDKAGGGTLTLSGVNTFTGTTNIAAGTLNIGSANGGLPSFGLGSVHLTTGPTNNLGDVSTSYTGVGGLVKSGTGNVTLDSTSYAVSNPILTATGAPTSQPQNVAAKVEPAAPAADNGDQPVARPASAVKFPQPVNTADNAFSTFALNVSDAAFQLARAALQNHRWPDPAAMRTEEFLNAFNYHDPAPATGEACALHYDLGQNPVEAGGDLLRVSLQTAAGGRNRETPLRLTILLDDSGSMTRADRVATVQAALRALGALLRAGDTVSLVTFARTPQVRLTGLPAERFDELLNLVAALQPEGGTNLEEALKTAYATARQTQTTGAQNRVILLTDGAANLGELDPAKLAGIVEENRRAGIALDAYGVGWDGYDDSTLEALTRKSDGRYAFLNGPGDVNEAFAAKLAGALAPAANDVKLQLEFNPRRVVSYRLMGYNNLRMTAAQFRDNTVNAGELAAADQGTALYNLVIDANGAGPIGTARARYRDPGTNNYHELSWTIDYNGLPPAFDQAAPALRLAGVAAYFAEYLQQSPYAAGTNPRALLSLLHGVPEAFAPDARPATLADTLTLAGSLAGN